MKTSYWADLAAWEPVGNCGAVSLQLLSLVIMLACTQLARAQAPDNKLIGVHL